MRTFSTFLVVTGAFVVALLIAAATLTVSGQARRQRLGHSRIRRRRS